MQHMQNINGMLDCETALRDGAAAWRALHGPRACAVPFVDHVLADHNNDTYGHIWSPIYSFFEHFVRTGRATANCSALAIPAFELTRRQLVYTELAAMLSTAALPVVRATWVPVCFQRSDRCCAEDRAQGIVIHEVRPWAQPAEQTAALRDHVVRAMQLDGGSPSEAAAADVVLISNRGASSGRRLGDEEAVSAALAATAARLGLRFGVLGAPTAAPGAPPPSFDEELRMLRGARFVVGLFGSALHNCRFLRPGTTLVELHGALGNDYRHGGYWNLCNCELGLHYVGVRTAFALPRLVEGRLVWGPDTPPSHGGGGGGDANGGGANGGGANGGGANASAPGGGGAAHAGHAGRALRGARPPTHNYQMHASVDAAEVGRALELAARGEWAELAHAYARDASIFDGREDARACFLRMVLARPCPPRSCVAVVKVRRRRR